MLGQDRDVLRWVDWQAFGYKVYTDADEGENRDTGFAFPFSWLKWSAHDLKCLRGPASE